MGCGTAILGILAAKMGARKVFAVDIDAVAARSAWGNARWNRVSRRVETACGDASLLQMGSYDVILANIHRNILLEDMPTYVRSLRHEGRLLLSGFYSADIPALRDRASSLGLTFVGQTLREDWACIEFARP
jgi:ribosomal protein L11 methyltransferase